MIASTIVYTTAVSSTAQMGNSFDTSGYRKNQPIVVLASVKYFSMGSERYLIVDKTQGLIGLASKVTAPDLDDPIYGEYYCTNARRISASWSVERALDSLGFGDVDADLVRQYL